MTMYLKNKSAEMEPFCVVKITCAIFEWHRRKLNQRTTHGILHAFQLNVFGVNALTIKF